MFDQVTTAQDQLRAQDRGHGDGLEQKVVESGMKKCGLRRETHEKTWENVGKLETCFRKIEHEHGN